MPSGAKPLYLSGRVLESRDLARSIPTSGVDVWVVQARGSAVQLQRQLLQAGLQIVGYLEKDAYLVLGVQEQIIRLSGLEAWGNFRPEWKIAPECWRLGPTASVRLVAWPGKTLGELSFSRHLRIIRVTRDFEGTEHALVQILGDWSSELLRLAARPEVSWIEPERQVVFQNDEALWVVQGGDFTTHNAPLFEKGVTGQGEIIAVADSGLDGDACQFRFSADEGARTLYNTTQPPAVLITDPDNKVITYYLLEGADAYDDFSKQGHGTHVAGSAAGDNFAHLAQGTEAGRDPQDGMAPAARLVIQDIGRRDGNQVGLTDSMVDLFQQAYDSGARVHNNSYGKTTPDINYSSDSREVDSAAWRLQDLVIVYSSGNLGPGDRTLAGLGATAKNSVVVGASLAGVSNRGYGVCHFSSQGPTADGRIKPDLVAPGAVRSARETDWIQGSGTDIYGNPIAYSTTDPPNNNCAVDESFRVGTSYAAPLVAGAAALVRQYFRQGHYPSGSGPAGGFPPSAALVKAILINAAESIGSAPNSVPGPLYDVSRGEKISDMEAAPNFIEGWGSLRLSRTVIFEGSNRKLAVLADVWNDGQERGAAGGPPMEEGMSRQWLLRQVSARSPLRVTLCWLDPAGAAGSGRTLVNDLDLEVEAAGALYRGNVNFVENRNQPAGGAGPDELNPLEQVIITPGSGEVLVRVRARRVPGNGVETPFPSRRQGYALVATGDFGGVCEGPQCLEVDGAGDGGDDASILDGADGGADPAAEASGPDAAGEDQPAGEMVVGGCACGSGGGGILVIWPAFFLWRRKR